MLQCGIHAMARPLLRLLFGWSALSLAAAFAVWLIDNALCSEVLCARLMQSRHETGPRTSRRAGPGWLPHPAARLVALWQRHWRIHPRAYQVCLAFCMHYFT